MSEPKYGEPWKWVTDLDDGLDGIVLANLNCIAHDSDTVSLPELHRAVACVNALAGRDPETVKRQLEERDKLLAMCKALVDHERTNRYGGLAAIPDDCFVAAKAEIAKAEKPK